MSYSGAGGPYAVGVVVFLWALPVLPVERLFLVGSPRITSEVGVLSERRIAPLFGQVFTPCLWSV